MCKIVKTYTQPACVCLSLCIAIGYAKLVSSQDRSRSEANKIRLACRNEED